MDKKQAVPGLRVRSHLGHKGTIKELGKGVQMRDRAFVQFDRMPDGWVKYDELTVIDPLQAGHWRPGPEETK